MSTYVHYMYVNLIIKGTIRNSYLDQHALLIMTRFVYVKLATQVHFKHIFQRNTLFQNTHTLHMQLMNFYYWLLRKFNFQAKNHAILNIKVVNAITINNIDLN